jgi:zinc protease
MCPVHVPALSPVVQRTVLPNGLTLIVQEVHTVPLVSAWCWYRVGSGDETPGLTGASHWVEHMNFKGTRHIPAAQMKGIIERHGGSWNGYTWIDQTTYLATAATRALPDILSVEAERMEYGLYDPAECESERTVIISELQGGENDPEQLLDLEVTATALRVHPYGHPVIGWLQDLESITRDDLYGHYRRYYAPNNAVLVIVGDVDPAEVSREVGRRFGSIQPRAVDRPRRQPEPPQIGERRVLIEREGTTAYLKLAYPSPAVSDPMFGPLLVLDAVLTGAKGVSLWSSFRGKAPQRKSLLYRALVDMGLASSVSGALLPTRDPYLYTITATAADGVPLEIVEDAALGAIDRVRSGVGDAEVARAKRQLRARMVFDADSVTNIAHQLGFFETIGAREVLDRLPASIGRVTAADVHEAAHRILSPASLTLGAFEPRVPA